MSEYLILIYEDESAYANGGQDEWARIKQAHDKFGAANAGALRGGHALQPTGTATSVRADVAGGFAVTDGAFAETKEALGGYYLVEAPDLDAAVAIAKQVPVLSGGVEVRPILTFE